jgi:hypothetical protein
LEALARTGGNSAVPPAVRQVDIPRGVGVSHRWCIEKNVRKSHTGLMLIS